MGGGDDVVVVEWPGRADRGGFLADREVDEPGDVAISVELGDAFFELANADHSSVPLELVVEFSRQGHRRPSALGLRRNQTPADTAARWPRLLPPGCRSDREG